MDDKFSYFLTLEDFRHEALKLVPISEFMQLKTDMGLYAKTVEVQHTFTQF